MENQCKVCFTRQILDAQQAIEFVSSPYCGATSIFLGTTRLSENGQSEKCVAHLEYEAYEDMALVIMREIVMNKLRGKDDGRHMAYVCHRLGRVDLGQASILIAVSSPHRSSCHNVVMEILNEIKQKVPIWKKVCFDSNEKDIYENNQWSCNSEAFWLTQVSASVEKQPQ